MEYDKENYCFEPIILKLEEEGFVQDVDFCFFASFLALTFFELNLSDFSKATAKTSSKFSAKIKLIFSLKQMQLP